MFRFLFFTGLFALGPATGAQSLTVYFDFGSDDLEPKAAAALDSWAEEAADSDEIILVEGHTDFIAGDAYNDGLARRRARAVAAYLEASGIDPARFRIAAFGESRPAAGNDEARGRALNRRVDLVLYAPGLQIEFGDAKDAAAFTLDDSTWMSFPPNAFVHPDGTPATGRVRFEVVTYRNLPGILRAGLHTVGDRGLLVTYGMYEVRAFARGEELRMAEGGTWRLDPPVPTPREAEIFYPRRAEADLPGVWTTDPSGAEEAGDTAAFFNWSLPTSKYQLVWIDPAAGSITWADPIRTFTFHYDSAELGKLPIVARNALFELDGFPDFAARLENYRPGGIRSAPVRFQVVQPIAPSGVAPVGARGFAVARLGWINVDRFLGSPRAEPTRIRVEGPDWPADIAVEARAYLVFLPYRTVLPLVPTEDGCWTADDKRTFRGQPLPMTMVPGDRAVAVVMAPSGEGYRIATARGRIAEGMALVAREAEGPDPTSLEDILAGIW